MIELATLTPKGQEAADVARRLASFLADARVSLELAIYDLRLTGEAAALVVDALEEAVHRGVRVRLAFNVDSAGPIPVPPPPQATPDEIEALPVDTRGIPGIPDLMHHKFVVRDGSAVWTGSANWTDDSWTKQENVLAVVGSPEIAAAYQRDFEQLWQTANVAASGDVDPSPVAVGGATVRAWFTPVRGEALSHRIASTLGRARRRIRICSPVITSGTILGTLAELASDHRVDLAGAVDLTQIEQVLSQWQLNHNAAWKTPALKRLLEYGAFSGKRSTPWAPGSQHDYMHAKITVADDTVFLGSFNLSHSGELNAENVLEIEDAALAERLASYVDSVRARYPRIDFPDMS
jgi:phosphatidylserine/phosphatidylglycerophosphate/cardiolipin synthase-like enzyme